MNKRMIVLLCGITWLMGFTACRKDFLEVVPQGKLIAKTAEDYSKLLNNPDLYFYNFSGSWEMQIMMGDELAAEALNLKRGTLEVQRLFQWADDIYMPANTLPQLLGTKVQNLYAINKVIQEVANATEATAEQKKALRAEALTARAWEHLQLINFFGKPYQAATAATDPGFPLMTAADVNVSKFPRATVQQVYDLIISDLTSAIDDLPLKVAYKNRVSRAAARGLLGKVYVFMGRYSDALPLLNAAMEDVAAAGNVRLYDYNKTLAAGGSFMPIDPITGPKGPGNNFNDQTEDILTRIFLNGTFSGSEFVIISPQTAVLYGTTDLRRSLYTSSGTAGAGRLRKYGVRYCRSGLQLQDLYLLRAECMARLNDPAGAIADVETLRRNRMPAADAPVPADLAGDSKALVKFIIDERIREFAAEGSRWYDMRRLSVDPLFAGITFQHTLYKEDGTTTVYTLNQPNRLVLRLPPALLNANPDMQDNP